jgi:hypothetical protein
MGAGDVGYIISGIKVSSEVKVGDTITQVKNPCDRAISGFEDVKPMVFAGIYPVDADEYEDLRISIEKLQLNDASLTFVPESSAARLRFQMRIPWSSAYGNNPGTARQGIQYGCNNDRPKRLVKVYTTKVGDRRSITSGMPANYIEGLKNHISLPRLSPLPIMLVRS